MRTPTPGSAAIRAAWCGSIRAATAAAARFSPRGRSSIRRPDLPGRVLRRRRGRLCLRHRHQPRPGPQSVEPVGRHGQDRLVHQFGDRPVERGGPDRRGRDNTSTASAATASGYGSCTSAAKMPPRRWSAPSGDIYVGVSLVKQNKKAEGRLVCINGQSHHIRWEYAALGMVESTPVMAMAGSFISATTRDDPPVDADGKRLWAMNVKTPVRSAGIFRPPPAGVRHRQRPIDRGGLCVQVDRPGAGRGTGVGSKVVRRGALTG